MKKRIGDPWIPAADYGRSLPSFMANLVVRDVDAALRFYRDVLLARVHYSDPDFAALRVLSMELMLHADHTYEGNPWSDSLQAGQMRGLGAELRLFGMNPDDLAARARSAGALFKEVSVRGHGWREVMVRDPDGYVWAVGEPHDGDDEPG